MSRILSIFLRVRIIKFIGIVNILVILSGCLFAQSYPFTLTIENKLKYSITYYFDENHLHAIHGGSNKEQIYISRGKKLNNEDIYKSFDQQKIIVCQKPIYFKRIRLVAPVVKLDDDHFEIVIDKRVTDAFCQRGSSSE
jgi:hypothetical protein